MQAILKGKHDRFSYWLEDIRLKLDADDDQLDQLGKEFLQTYKIYLQKIEELRKVVSDYERKQKMIRNRVKELQRLCYSLKNSRIEVAIQK